MDRLKIKRAILSVTNKNLLTRLGSFLANNGVELISTGGTKKYLEDAGLQVTAVSQVTGFPEILNGRVKTLHPHIHAGILADKDNSEHMETLAAMNIAAFDLVCVNLYDFSGAIEKRLSLRQTIEEIDIGGPCMLRAAAKNFHSILVLPDPQWYDAAINEMKNNDMTINLAFRQLMASHTFDLTSRYDAIISNRLQTAN